MLQFQNIQEQVVNLWKKNDQYQYLIWLIENLKEYQKHPASLRNSYLHFHDLFLIEMTFVNRQVIAHEIKIAKIL